MIILKGALKMTQASESILCPLNLQLFGDGGAESAESSETTESTSTGVEQTEKQAEQDEAPLIAEEEKEKVTAESRKAEFEKLIKGDYKDLFTERTQQIIDKRFKETKTLEESNKKLQPMLQKLSTKYGVKDIDALFKAVESDDSVYEAFASENGISIDKAREFKTMQDENAQFRAVFEERSRKEEMDKIYGKWVEQAEEAKQFYPDFDLGTEMDASPSFVQLMQAGIDVKTAYEVSHKDEILTRVATVSARKAEKRVVDSIKAKGTRPSENGTGSQGGISVSKDINKLTNDELDDYIKRARQGETIDFKS